MSHKQKSKTQKKVKSNLNKPEPRPIIHVNYLQVYHEVLKHEEVLDVELDVIFGHVQTVFDESLTASGMVKPPSPEAIEQLVSKSLDLICA